MNKDYLWTKVGDYLAHVERMTERQEREAEYYRRRAEWIECGCGDWRLPEEFCTQCHRCAIGCCQCLPEEELV